MAFLQRLNLHWLLLTASGHAASARRSTHPFGPYAWVQHQRLRNVGQRRQRQDADLSRHGIDRLHDILRSGGATLLALRPAYAGRCSYQLAGRCNGGKAGAAERLFCRAWRCALLPCARRAAASCATVAVAKHGGMPAERAGLGGRTKTSAPFLPAVTACLCCQSRPGREQSRQCVSSRCPSSTPGCRAPPSPGGRRRQAVHGARRSGNLCRGPPAASTSAECCTSAQLQAACVRRCLSSAGHTAQHAGPAGVMQEGWRGQGGHGGWALTLAPQTLPCLPAISTSLSAFWVASRVGTLP